MNIIPDLKTKSQYIYWYLKVYVFFSILPIIVSVVKIEDKSTMYLMNEKKNVIIHFLLSSIISFGIQM